MNPRTLAIIGGGFAGTSAAVQAVRLSQAPLEVTLIDPAASPGPGLAHATPDPDHRLNAPTFVHSLLPEDIGHFSRWCVAQRVLDADPEALQPDGTVYVRRAVFGRYLAQTLQQHAGGPGGSGDRPGHPDSRIRHLRARALALSPAAPHAHARPTAPGAGGAEIEAETLTPTGWQVQTDAGPVTADALILATGNAATRLPAPFDALAAQPGEAAARFPWIADPWAADAADRLRSLPAGATVLVLGQGLTALDLLCTLIRERPDLRLEVLSRRGLRPQPQGPWPAALAALLAAVPPQQGLQALQALPPGLLLDRIQGTPPAFLHPGTTPGTNPGTPPGTTPATARGWLRALRRAAQDASAAGLTWHTPFDALRDTLHQTWPTLPAAERRRILARLRPFYDVHRFRTAPQNDAMLQAAIARGQVRLQAGRITEACLLEGSPPRLQLAWRPIGAPAAAAPAALQADALLNCTGTDARASVQHDPLLRQALADGWLSPDDSGLGVAVDRLARARDRSGRWQPTLRVIGPPTVGAMGDAIGAIFIAAQARRMLADLLQRAGSGA